MQRFHLLLGTAGIVQGAVASAIILPSTHIACDCPAPAHAIRAFRCVCPVDHQIPLRIAIAGGGTSVAEFLRVLANRARAAFN